MFKLARVFGVQLPDNYLNQALELGDKEKALNIYKTYLNVKASEDNTSYKSLIVPTLIGAGIGGLVAYKTKQPIVAAAGAAIPFLMGGQLKSIDDNEIERAKIYRTLPDDELERLLVRELGITAAYKEKHPFIMEAKEGLSDSLYKTAGWKKNVIFGSVATALLYKLLNRNIKPFNIEEAYKQKVITYNKKPTYDGPKVIYGYKG